MIATGFLMSWGLLTCCLPLPCLAPFQVQAQDVTECSELDEGQSMDLFHVFQGQVSCPRQAKSAFGDPKLLGRQAEIIAQALESKCVGSTYPPPPPCYPSPLPPPQGGLEEEEQSG